jgi:hypothetical protein
MSNFSSATRKSSLLFFLVLVLLLSVLVQVPVADGKEDPQYYGGETVSYQDATSSTTTPSTSTMTRQEQVTAFVNSRFVMGNPAALQDPTSPQSMAVTWMATEDPLMIPIPESNAYSDSFPFVQRYTLTVLYFSWSRTASNSTPNLPFFINGNRECDWNTELSIVTGETLTMGAQCNEDGEIDRLVLRKYTTDHAIVRIDSCQPSCFLSWLSSFGLIAYVNE